MNFFETSNAVKENVPELTSIQRVVLVANIAGMSLHENTDFSKSDLTAVIRFLNLTGTIDKTQREYLLSLMETAEKERMEK